MGNSVASFYLMAGSMRLMCRVLARGRLIQRQVLCQEAVENLHCKLFFGSQSRILHGENVTFMLLCWPVSEDPFTKR